MNKLWRIVLHEYRRNVLKRGFILALLSVPIMLSVNIGMGMFLESRKNNYAPLGYVDQSGLLADPIPAPLASHVKRVPLRPFPTEEHARAALEAGAIQAYYVLSARFVSTGRAELAYLEPPGGNATSQFYDFIQINLLSDRAAASCRGAALRWASFYRSSWASLWPSCSPSVRAIP
jgi:ABC-type Na+ efflux pump permease subunit